ncbi:MAG: hypothetical protein LBT80_00815 [Lactobacillaceae bacterium]|jgi:hypothetical protein|nr:hypothetical protein [Lactobacillaceae bacterium]
MITAFSVLEIAALIALLWAAKGRVNKFSIVILVLISIINAIYVYVVMPVPNIMQLAMPVAVVSIMVTFATLAFVLGENVYARVSGGRKNAKQASAWSLMPFSIALIAVAVVFAGSISQAMTVRPMYQSITQEVKKEAPLTKDDQPIALSTQASENMMKKAFSQVPDSSLYRLGDLSAQYIDGKPYYVAPVEYNGFMSWFMHRSLPGYFKISATDMNDTAHFVKEPLTYSETSYLNYNIARKIYFKNAKYQQAGEPILEINEQGQAYWVQTLLNMRWAGQLTYNDIHVSLTNATNGHTTVYATDKLPDWVDVGVSPEAATKMNRTFGNPYALNFQHKNQIKPTENGSEAGVTPVFNADKTISYFDDFTTVTSNADSDKGYSMINSRTGKLTFYTGKNVGIMDSDGAMKVAKQLHPQNKWHGSNPVIMNIDGTPTWVVSMMDSNERFREYAYIKGADQNVIGEGDTAADALTSYRNSLASNFEAASSNDASVKVQKITGKVTRVNPNADLNDKQVVIFKLENDEVLYTIDPDKNQLALLMQPGDEVQIKVKVIKGAKVANVINFTDNTLK